jgi:hypothetical protein
LSASLSLIPNPSYLSPSFAVRRVEVYRHLNGLVERRRVEPIANRPGTSRVFRPREYVDEAPEKPAGTGSERLMSFNSGTRSTMSDPFGSGAC